MEPQYAFAQSPFMMASGGLAAAQHAQSKGRGSDSMLVHMTPGEVGGLQALAMKHGGSLSINPSTGLPEAGFLRNILPLVAGFALGPAGFGLMGAGTAGLTVGGLTGLATGSLKKGLMAGIGAYGGAGMGQGLVNAATPLEAASSQVAQAPTSAFELAQSNIDPGILESGLGAGSKNAIMQQAIQSPAYQQALTGSQLVGSPGLDTMAASNVAQAQVLPGQMVTTTPAAAVPQGLDAATSGFENVFTSGPAGANARAAFSAATPFGTLPAAGVTAASALTPDPAELETPESYIRPFSLEIDNTSGQDPYTAGSTEERRQLRYRFSPKPIYKAAEGGQVPTATPSSQAASISPEAAAIYAAIARTQQAAGLPAIDMSQNLARGGVAQPRFLSGGGDGMSDSIKANINGVQEARLADGEFVVPADVVSHLGNGSSKAGAKKLYAMMDRIRKARTGKTRQAPEVKAERLMPA